MEHVEFTNFQCKWVEAGLLDTGRWSFEREVTEDDQSRLQVTEMAPNRVRGILKMMLILRIYQVVGLSEGSG